MSESSESPSDLSSEAPLKQNGGGAPPVALGLRRLFAIAVFAAILGLGITLSFGYADHDPRPHGVRIAVAGSPAVRAHVAAGLERAQPDGFDVVGVASAQAAARSVRGQSTAGALIVPASGPTTIVTAGAEGVTQKQALTKALTAASAAMHRTAKPLDVAPLPPGDSSGLSSFVFGLGLLIPSVIGSIGIFLFGMRFRLWWRVAAGTLFALLAAVGGVLAMHTILGALTGAGAALIGIGFLGALSFVLFVAALQALVGMPGTALAAIAFIFVGNAISGGTVPIGFLPGGFRQIAPWLPNNALIRGARDIVYFNGHDLGHPLLVLALWPAVALIILAAIDLLHVSERRRTPHLAQDIYRTPAIVHVGRRLDTRRPRTDTTPAASLRGGKDFAHSTPTTVPNTRSKIMFRFISWLTVGIAAAFLVVAAASFSLAATAWLAFAIGIGTLVVSASVAYRYRTELASLVLALATVVVSAWTIVSSLVFSQTTVQSLALASALAISGLAILGLTAHEIENDDAASSRQREDTSRDTDSRLAAAA